MPRILPLLASMLLMVLELSFPGTLAADPVVPLHPGILLQETGKGSASEDATRPPAGIVIEEVAKGSALERAGLHQGDLIFFWERGSRAASERGDIESPLDWLWIETEQAPRGGVTLTGERDGEVRQFDIPLGRWGARVLPRMSADELAVYRKGQELVAAGKVREGIATWNQLTGRLAAERLRIWIRLRQAEALSAAGIWEEALAAYREAIADVRTPREKALVGRDLAKEDKNRDAIAPAEGALHAALDILGSGERESLLAAAIRQDLGTVSLEQRKLDAAQEWSESALVVRERLAGGSLDNAESLAALGIIALLRHDLALAETRLQASLRLREAIDPDSLEVSKSLNSLGVLAKIRGEPAKAAAYWGQALAIRERFAPGSLESAGTLNNLGILAHSQGNPKGALIYFGRSLEIYRRLKPGSLEEADALNNLGSLQREQGDLVQAQSHFERALVIREKLAPASPTLAGSLISLGLVRKMRGDLEGAESYLRQALLIQDKLSPGGSDRATTLGNLANVAELRGDLALAEELSRQSLAINMKNFPDGLNVAHDLNQLGHLAWLRGNVEAAEDQFRKALGIYSQAAAKSLGAASSLNNLANIYWSRGDLDTAAEYLKRSLEISRAVTPNGPNVADSLHNLGNVAARQGDLKSARKYHEESLMLREKVSATSLETAFGLADLGAIILLQGDLDLAERLLVRSLRIKERLAPGSLTEAESLKNLAEMTSRRGDLQRAKALYQRALANQRHLAPGTAEEADTLQALAAVTRKSGQPKEALPFLLQSLTALESQVGRLGGSDLTRAAFRAQYASYYRDAISLLLELRQPEEAFHILERSRARSLLAMLAERELVFTADIPSALEARRRTVARRYEQVQRSIGESGGAADSAQMLALLHELTDLRRQHEEVVAEIRRVSPRLATLQYPEPLDLAGTKTALDPGTLALSYSVGEEATYLFAVHSAGPLTVIKLPHGDAWLRSEIGSFLSILETARPGSPIGEARRMALKAQAQNLYQDLLGPVESLIEQSKRLLIVPDGPLQRLPWGALRGGVSGTQYLGESKPFSIAPSITVFAELKRTRPASGGSAPVRLVAFGDPLCRQLGAGTAGEIGDPHVRAALSRGRICDPIPASRIEVNGVGGLFPEHVRLHLGNEATEENAKAIGRDVRYLHFATHGILDERFPLDSAIVLTPPEKFEAGKENGLLQAWEIFEQVRLNADLVVLSACESGLGKEMGGEGLIGLTRAFQYAGARSVMASLWKISDRTTAELMVRFYKHLKDGLPKDEALRAAQMELIRGPIQVKNEKGEVEEIDASAPYYWAAFQIYGDWQ